MKIEREEEVTYTLTLSGDEAQELYDALNDACGIGQAHDHAPSLLFSRLYDDGYRCAPTEPPK